MTSHQCIYDEDSDCIVCGRRAFTPDPAARIPPFLAADTPVPPAGACGAPVPPGAPVAGPVPPVAGPATPSSPRVLPLPGETPSSPLPLPPPRVAAGMPDPGLAPGRARAGEAGYLPPGTGTARGAVPGGSHPDVPAGASTAGTEGRQGRSRAEGEPPAVRDGQGGKPAASSGAEWRDRVRAVQSAQARARRTAAGRYVPKAQRAAGSQFRAGMSRRMPPTPQGGDAA